MGLYHLRRPGPPQQVRGVAQGRATRASRSASVVVPARGAAREPPLLVARMRTKAPHARSCAPNLPRNTSIARAIKKVALAVFLFVAGFSMLAGGLYIWYTHPGEGKGAGLVLAAQARRACAAPACVTGQAACAAPFRNAPLRPSHTWRPRCPLPQQPRCWCWAASASYRARTTRVSHTSPGAASRATASTRYQTSSQGGVLPNAQVQAAARGERLAPLQGCGTARAAAVHQGCKVLAALAKAR